MTTKSLLKDLALIWLGTITVDVIAALVKSQSFLTTLGNGLEIPIGLSIAWFLRFLWARRKGYLKDNSQQEGNI